jgi:hypothetical protein
MVKRKLYCVGAYELERLEVLIREGDGRTGDKRGLPFIGNDMI